MPEVTPDQSVFAAGAPHSSLQPPPATLFPLVALPGEPAGVHLTQAGHSCEMQTRLRYLNGPTILLNQTPLWFLPRKWIHKNVFKQTRLWYSEKRPSKCFENIIRGIKTSTHKLFLTKLKLSKKGHHTQKIVVARKRSRNHLPSCSFYFAKMFCGDGPTCEVEV